MAMARAVHGAGAGHLRPSPLAPRPSPAALHSSQVFAKLLNQFRWPAPLDGFHPFQRLRTRTRTRMCVWRWPLPLLLLPLAHGFCCFLREPEFPPFLLTAFTLPTSSVVGSLSRDECAFCCHSLSPILEAGRRSYRLLLAAQCLKRAFRGACE